MFPHFLSSEMQPWDWALMNGMVMYECESWTITKAEHWRTDVFEFWHWRRLLRVPWTARRSNQPILREWVKVAQSCLTFCNPMDYTVHGILQARILEWVAFPFSRGSSQPRDQTGVSCIAGRFFTNWVLREALLEEKTLQDSSLEEKTLQEADIKCHWRKRKQFIST